MEMKDKEDKWDQITVEDLNRWEKNSCEIKVGCEVIFRDGSDFKSGIVLMKVNNGLIRVLVGKKSLNDTVKDNVVCVSKTTEDCIRMGLTKIK